uniref:Uncharacterized protein n=1 Tax=uncultured Flavobacteriia bacterium TaxID=212695 RepID=H6RFJ7_9BACT|nr:hypothetical protein, exported [uncultured Flavobacteriia bacterium]
MKILRIKKNAIFYIFLSILILGIIVVFTHVNSQF